ncbi:unnamed protein product [Prunus armeniaca]
MHPRRPRMRGGHVPRWGANPPSQSPSPSPSPPPSPPSPPSPPVEGHDGGNGRGLRHLLSQFTRTVSTALQVRRNTKGLDIKRCPDGDKVCLAAFILKGNAYHWWKTVRRGYTNPAAIIWEEFQRAFCDQFYSHTYKTAKRVEFLHLRQGSMSVFEYEHKFNELSRFAPELVTTKEDKCTRFKEGLWLDIQAVVTATIYPTMRALAQAADRMANTYSLGAVRVHQRGVDPALVLPVVVGEEDVGLVPAVGGLALNQLGASTRDNNRWAVQPGTLSDRDWGPAGSRAQGQTQSGASSSAAGSSLSSGVQSTFRGRSGRGQRGQSGHSTTQARVF